MAQLFTAPSCRWPESHGKSRMSLLQGLTSVRRIYFDCESASFKRTSLLTFWEGNAFEQTLSVERKVRARCRVWLSAIHGVVDDGFQIDSASLWYSISISTGPYYLSVSTLNMHLVHTFKLVKGRYTLYPLCYAESGHSSPIHQAIKT